MIRSGLTLATLMALSAALLLWVEGGTRSRIAANETARRAAIIAELTGVPLPADGFGDVVACPDIRFDHRVVVLAGSGDGYGGAMRLLVAFDSAGRVAGVRVVTHGETPGFADVLAPGDWIDRFAGTSPGAVEAVSGATITSRAVLRAVAEQATRFAQGRPWCPTAEPA